MDGSNPVQITFEPSNEIDPSWSPDGSMISFTSNRKGINELFIMNADGSDIRQVTTGMSIGGRNDWSPDGRWLTFYAGVPTKEVYLVPIECAQLVVGCDRSLIRRLTDGGNNKGPSFSPDGLWITYASGNGANNEIMIIRIDGSEVTRLTDNNTSDWQPRWGW
jgi:Tol biopolymer transport system component